jgi:hypothetical protein
LTATQATYGATPKFNNDPPEIIYAKRNSVLLLFDGDPVFKEIENTGLKRAVNTPFFVLQDLKNKTYYLYGTDFWYKSMNPITGAWSNIPKPPSNVVKVFDDLNKQIDYSGNSAQTQTTSQPLNSGVSIPDIIVRTKPSELIQSSGEPAYAPIQGTQLLYMTNTDDNIFMTIDNNQYFILVSGRWYHSSALSGPWSFIDSDKLPPDFARIPEGSEKDVVLASIAGTNAAKDAVMDAQIPQTAAVDRKTATCVVEYDGDPKFEKIEGTELARGMNTSSVVLMYQNIFYVCDNAVWFTGNSPTGPWEVATSIPDEIQNIPPDDPDYNVRYVYIYDVDPDMVYTGYTPGYTGCYIDGQTVVYGTGWYYSPFYGTYYYPRPYTYGFHMNYNPWFGWSMGFSMSRGWFRYSYGRIRGWRGGWWGPPMYHPPYHPRYNHYYGPRKPVYHGGTAINIKNTRTNIYNKRSDGSAKPVSKALISPRPIIGNQTGKQQPPDERIKPGISPGAKEIKPATRVSEKKNNVYADPKGNVYRDNNGEWQKNNGKDWNTVQPKPQVEKVVQPKPQVAPQPVRVAQPPQPVRVAQPPQQDRNAGFNRQEMENQNAARQRGAQNMNNNNTIQHAMPANNGGSRNVGGNGKKR